MEFLELLLGTIWLRPYVFIFLFSYLVIATLDMGVKRSILFTALAFGIVKGPLAPNASMRMLAKPAVLNTNLLFYAHYRNRQHCVGTCGRGGIV